MDVVTSMPPMERYTLTVKVRNISAGRINAEAFGGAVCSGSILPVEDIVVHPPPLEHYVVKAKIRNVWISGH